MELTAQLLSGIYMLPHHPAPRDQNVDNCKTYMRLFVTILKPLWEAKIPPPWLSTEELTIFQRCKPFFEETSCEMKMLEFYPRYGCAVIAHSSAYMEVGTVKVLVLGLDKFERVAMHPKKMYASDRIEGTSLYDVVRVAHDYGILTIKNMTETDLDKVKTKFESMLTKTQFRKGDDRSAKGGARQGHQFTPAMIHALWTQAAACPCDEGQPCQCKDLPPVGGWTDNGLHTGGMPTNTSAPLVTFLLKWWMKMMGDTNASIYHRIAVQADLWIARSWLEELQRRDPLRDVGLTRKMLDGVHEILVTMTLRFKELDETRHNLSDFVEQARTLSGDINTLSNKLEQFEATGRVLKSADLTAELNNPAFLRDPVLTVDLNSSWPEQSPSLQEIRNRLEQNLEVSPIYDYDAGFDIVRMRDWAKHPSLKPMTKRNDAWLLVRTVEKLFFERVASEGFEINLAEKDILMLVELLDWYRATVNEIFLNLDPGHHPKIETQSRELLVTWISYCFVFQSCKKIYQTELRDVGVCLKFEGLKHLVLSEREHVKALHQVKCFLQTFYREGFEFFSQRCPEITFDVGVSFSRLHFSHIHQDEMRDAKSRELTYWMQVVCKQQRLVQLRGQLSQLQDELSDLETRRKRARVTSKSSQTQWSRGHERDKLIRLDSCWNEKHAEVQTKQEQIANEQVPPPRVIQPLPKLEANAHRWLFFLFMPKSLKSLASLSFTAQSLLLPRCSQRSNAMEANVITSFLASLNPKLPLESIAAFYNSKKNSAYLSRPSVYEGTDSDVRLKGTKALEDLIPKYPTSVDNINSLHQGVWYPDAWLPRMAWFGGSNSFDQVGHEVNPFLLPAGLLGMVEDVTSLYFTEKLQRPDLQWAMQVSSFCNRGNVPIATQQSKPVHWTKSQYLVFGKIRSHEIMQLRHIAVAFLEDNLPWAESEVHALLIQAFFQIGELGTHEEESYAFLWKQDLYRGDLCEALQKTLNATVEKLVNTPNGYRQMPIVSTICGFLASWDMKFKDMSRKLGKALVRWANEMPSQIAVADRAQSNCLKAKHCTLLRVALLCFVNGPIDCNDAQWVLSLTLKARNLFVKEESDELKELASNCMQHTTARLKDIGIWIDAESSLLTTALQYTIGGCPQELPWRKVRFPEADRTACFEASSDDCIYHLNIVTGAVLVDGLPPTSLPVSILEHTLYQRTFGELNFEVVSKHGIFESIDSNGGCRYRFCLSGRRLYVREISENPEKGIVDLLDWTEVETWGAELPKRVRLMHSHWLSSVYSCILCRGPRYDQKEISFVLSLKPKSLVAFKFKCIARNEMVCASIPVHLRKKSLSHIVSKRSTECSTLKLCAKDSAIVSVLQRFEDRELIHFLIRPDGSKIVELPRFALSFRLAGGYLHCCQLTGLVLSEQQYLVGSLSGFVRFIVLQRVAGASASLRSIIVPSGEILTSGSGIVDVVLSQDRHDTERSYYLYNVHVHFNTFEATRVTARLHLAALHVATSTRRVDHMYGRTGSERAAEILRQCYVSRPLDDDQKKALGNVRSLSRGVFATISLLCIDIERFAAQTSFLHTGSKLYDQNTGIAFDPAELDLVGISTLEEGIEVDAYLLSSLSGRLSRRNMLSKGEARRITGETHAEQRVCGEVSFFPCVDIGPHTIEGGGVESLEKKLFAESLEIAENRCIKEFPMRRPSNETALEHQLFQELLRSWTCSSQVEQFSLKKGWTGKVDEIASEAAHLKASVQHYLVESMDSFATKLDGHVRPLFASLLKATGLLPSVSIADFARALYDQAWILQLNPLLGLRSRKHIFEATLVLLRLCVLEDKLKRIQLAQSIQSDSDAIKELKSRRSWDPSEFPCWLAFEVDRGIQIRPEQVVVARHLIENPGHVVQLNMGMGKTRVILPMLALHWSHHTENDRVTRINILSSLLSETHIYFLDALSGGVARMKIFLMPFSRDVDATEHGHLAVMSRFVDRCRHDRGVFLVAPEHRASMELKVVELARMGPERSGLSASLHELCYSAIWRDVLDECDEMLHHRYQLIYATGAVGELPDGPNRYKAVQVLLSALHEHKECLEWISMHNDLFVREPEGGCEAFAQLRVNSRFATERLLAEFRSVVVCSILTDPPCELEWLRNHPAKKELEKVLLLKHYPSKHLPLAPDHYLDVLALRGLLAGDILTSCLQKRHRVNYGISRSGSKRIAVPFHAADVPSPRAEFAHPDCAIVYTCLSYYSDGLGKEQVRNVFKCLLDLGDESRRAQYRSWLELSWRDIPPAKLARLDCVEKLDLSNSIQFVDLMRHFRFNIRTINFWLNTCVFPDEMQHYPQRMTATSWNLAEDSAGQGVVGFSGTNDNHQILPLQVRQPSVEEFCPTQTTDCVLNELFGTNGHMIRTILNTTTQCQELKDGLAGNALFEFVRDSADSIDAVIDCGALLAGRSGIQVASRLQEVLQDRHCAKTIIYFDADYDRWNTLETSGKIAALDQSAVSNRDTFAYFDDSHCRGSDLKLDPEATAAITLGPGMCKDKFMQAAGRMRQLDGGQQLVIVGTRDIMNQVRQMSNSGCIGSKEVLQWTLHNTAASISQGLLAWASQGWFHATSHQHSQLVVEEEHAGLKDLYGFSFEAVNVGTAAKARRKYYLERAAGAGADHSVNKSLVKKISDRVDALGSIKVQVIRGLDEQCEREMELEREEEEEDELEIPIVKAQFEGDWDVSCVFAVDDISSLPPVVGALSLTAFFAKHLAVTSRDKINWSENVLGTRNFFLAVCDQGGTICHPSNQYLRLVDSALYFPASGQLLLLSEREAGKLVKYIWQVRAGSVHQPPLTTRVRGPLLFQLKFASAAADGKIQGLRPSLLSLSPDCNRNVQEDIPENILANAQLFGGETVFATEQRRDSVKCMLQYDAVVATTAPRELVAMRGNAHCYDHSDLEKVCRALAWNFEFALVANALGDDVMLVKNEGSFGRDLKNAVQ